MKKILIIAYHFPPRGGIAVKRTLKFVKTLPLFAWGTVILTVKLKQQEYKILDMSLLEELPDALHIYRTEYLNKQRFLKRLFRKFKKVTSKKEISCNLFIDPEDNLFKKGLNFIFSFLWPYIPDIESGWIPYALNHGRHIIDKEGIDAIYTTSPPHSTHLIGYVLSNYTKRPWVADFRDDWISNPLFKPSNIIMSKVHGALESIIVRNAYKIILTNRHTKENFLRKHPNCPEDKFIVIPNGYDPEDFKNLENKPFDRFTIIHTGTFGNLTAKYFLFAFSSLIEEHPEMRENVNVLFLGGIPGKDKKIADELKLNGIISVQQHISHKECLQQLVRSHLFLLFLTGEAGGAARTPAKIYEYLAVGRPILGMVVEGDAADKIREMNLGSVIAPTDVEGIKNEIYRYYQKYLSNREKYFKPLTSQEDLDKYNPISLTQRLVEVLT